MKKTILFYTLLFFHASPVLQAQTLHWDFPIHRTHAGILLGNGVQGLMVWGDTTLNITVGRAGFWDHRGGNDFAARANFGMVKALVKQRDEDSLRKLFTYVPPKGEPARPQHLGGGVLKLHLPKGCRLLRGELNMREGTVTVVVQSAAKKVHRLFIKQSPLKELAWVQLPEALMDAARTELLPMWEWNREKLVAAGIAPPMQWSESNVSGFTQTLPADLPLSIGVVKKGGNLLLATNVGSDAKASVLKTLKSANLSTETISARAWWNQYWNEVARITIPDPVLQEAYDYGLYKQACTTPPQGLACTLQGAFMEEYQLPPWSNDYHFNINEQLIYTPALATNRPQHFKPLLQLIDSLLPVFRRNGKLFFGNEAAIMFPHAVDDRGQAIGNYWGGTIDHATTAWVAFLTWQYYQYSGDTTYLRRLTFPLLTGAFEGFWSMLEKETSASGQTQYSLPLSVSPEYGSGLEGVGKNSSFQLAALHRVLRILPEAATRLQVSQDSRWADVQQHLPLYSLVQTPYGESSRNTPLRIGLWEGKDLDISHRHHSHLAGIYPFQTISLSDTAQYKVAEKSYWRWVHGGAGMWTGWCIPWASILHNRMGNTEAAISWLHYWRQNFVNEGRGTLHNATNNGMSAFNEPPYQKTLNRGDRNHEIMQLDAGFGAVSAILDLLVQESPDGIHILKNRHWAWKNLSFERVRTAGGFLVDAVVSNNEVQRIRITAATGGRLQLHHGLGKVYLLNNQKQEGEELNLVIEKGKTIELKPMPSRR